MDQIVNWIKANKTLAYIAGGVVFFMFILPMLKPQRRRRTVRKPVVNVRARKRKTVVRTGVKTGKKPAWMVKGSPEAKARMAKLRRMRG